MKFELNSEPPRGNETDAHTFFKNDAMITLAAVPLRCLWAWILVLNPVLYRRDSKEGITLVSAEESVCEDDL
jgi:hypothetical protein